MKGRPTASLLHILFVLGLLMATALSARAQDLGELAQGGSLVIPLDVTNLTGEVAIEIDDIDVTEFASIAGGQLVISPGAPLGSGAHTVTVYLFQGAGYEIIGNYSFSVGAASDATTTGSAGLTLGVEATHEVGGRILNGDSEEIASSTGTVEVTTVDNSFTGRADYLATLRDEDQINGKPVNIGQYFLEYKRTGGTVDFTGRLGHQTLTYDPVLIGDVNRRGVSLLFNTPDERFRFGAFNLRSSDALGVDNITGIQESDDRMVGAQLAFRPFAANDFRISAQVYDGKGTPNGGLIAGAGNGFSMGFDGSVMQGRLRYGAFYGRTEWDEDAGGVVFAEDSGEAVLTRLEFDVLGHDGGSRILTIGLDYEIVDYGFYSLANPGIATGGETFRFTADYAADQFGFSLYADTQKTNEGGLPTWATDRISRVAFDGYYDVQGQGFWQNATLRFGTYVDWQDRLVSPPATPIEDFTAVTYYMGLEKYSDAWSWSLTYDYVDDNDQSPSNIDTKSHNLQAFFDYTVNDRLALNGTGLVTYQRSSPDKWWRYEAGVGGIYDIVPGKWQFALNAGYTMSDEPFALDGGYISTELSWQFNPAAELVLSAAYSDGPYTETSGAGHDASIGLLLRAQTSILR